MPRSNAQRKIVIADSEEELAEATQEAAAQRPGEHEPEPIPPQPEDPDEPVPEDPEGEEIVEDDEDEEKSDEDDEDDDEKAVAAPLIPAAGLHYESRIVIVDAWQYPGSLKNAPDWIDRNWVGYGDYDELREIKPGPCLRVPLQSGITAIVRIGDYVATQEVKLAEGVTDIRLEAWQRDQFEKLFIPKPAIEHI